MKNGFHSLIDWPIRRNAKNFLHRQQHDKGDL